MRIVNAMFGQGLGGIEQAVIDYSDALALAGHEVHVLIHPRAAIRAGLEKRHTVHVLDNWGAWDGLAVLKLRRLLASLAPDTCIAHGNRAASLLASAGAKQLIGVTHNYKARYTKLAAVFCPTKHLMQHAEAQGVAREHIYYMPNMVRVPADFSSRAWRTPPVIGSMGRLVAKKGFEVFINALVNLKSRKIPFAAILAGDGEERDMLKTLAEHKNVRDNLAFPGWIKDKQAFFGNIDVFCLPSHHEPFGIVLLEAMAQGIPVVSTDSEGPSEIIHKGIDGVIVRKNSVSALADGLALLLMEPGRAQLMARHAYDMVKKHYDLSQVSAKLDLAVRSVGQL